MEWISVQERLPEGPTAALVTDGNSVVPADWLEDERYFYVSRDEAGFPRNRISHWMPFPEPPGRLFGEKDIKLTDLMREGAALDNLLAQEASSEEEVSLAGTHFEDIEHLIGAFDSRESRPEHERKTAESVARRKSGR